MNNINSSQALNGMKQNSILPAKNNTEDTANVSSIKSDTPQAESRNHLAGLHHAVKAENNQDQALSKVSELKSKYINGDYKVDFDLLADKLVNEYFPQK